MGIGNTAIACKELDINCVGFEIDKVYFNEAIRILEEGGQLCLI
jgi:DNA modification methylase